MNNNSSSSGLGLASVLTIIFVVLKLIGAITWSWWWVFSPILIDLALSIIILVIYAIYITRRDGNYGYTSKRSKKDKWKF